MPNIKEWLRGWDVESVPDFDDKLRECEFFFAILSSETDRNKFRWLVSAFLNAVYSFFESSALTAHFRYTDPDTGEPREDDDGMAALQRHLHVKQGKKNPEFVKTAPRTPLTELLYDFRNKSTHRLSLCLMAEGPSLPEDFYFGSIRGQGIQVMPLLREALELIRAVHGEIST